MPKLGTLVSIPISDIRERSAYRPAGYFDDVTSAGEISGNTLLIPLESWHALREKYGQPEQPSIMPPPAPDNPPDALQSSGPGTQLHKLLHEIGLDFGAGCKCAEHIREMDSKGADWCELNTETIVGWLKSEASRRALPFFAAPARMLVHKAIALARVSESKPV